MKRLFLKFLLLTLGLLPVSSLAQTKAQAQRKPVWCTFPPPPNWKPEYRGKGTADEPYDFVEQMPEFPGGHKAILDFIGRHLRWPARAIRDYVEGRVYVKFVVDKTGQVQNPVVVKGLGAGCDEEALRVVKLLPRFSPGREKDKPVAVYYNVPVKFEIKY